VGKIYDEKFWIIPISVHPHIRGENLARRRFVFCGLGSPPHTWGKCSLTVPQVHDSRFTPTYVGKITPPPTEVLLNPVHPHIRGENAFRPCDLFLGSGSPPHTWGKFYQLPYPIFFDRFTPTYVGKIYTLLIFFIS